MPLKTKTTTIGNMTALSDTTLQPALAYDVLKPPAAPAAIKIRCCPTAGRNRRRNPPPRPASLSANTRGEAVLRGKLSVRQYSLE